jgi:hypothetical protein
VKIYSNPWCLPADLPSNTEDFRIQLGDQKWVVVAAADSVSTMLDHKSLSLNCQMNVPGI